MSKKVDVNLLEKELSNYLANYSEDISEEVKTVADKVGKEATNELKQISPKGVRGQYAKGWRLRKDKINKNRYIVKVHNATDYQLTHLLEFGHATRNGGRTKPIPHIRPIEEKYSKVFEEEIKKEIRRIK